MRDLIRRLVGVLTFRPRHTADSVPREIVEGIESGSVAVPGAEDDTIFAENRRRVGELFRVAEGAAVRGPATGSAPGSSGS